MLGHAFYVVSSRISPGFNTIVSILLRSCRCLNFELLSRVLIKEFRNCCLLKIQVYYHFLAAYRSTLDHRFIFVFKRKPCFSVLPTLMSYQGIHLAHGAEKYRGRKPKIAGRISKKLSRKTPFFCQHLG